MRVWLSWDGMRAGIALGPNPLGKDDPGQDFTAGRGGGGPSKLSGAEVEAMTQCIGSLMTQAWAGGQTDIFSVEKLLWGPPSGTSLLPTSCRGSLGTKPWGVGFLCVCVCVCTPALLPLLQRPPTQPGYTALDM